MKIEGIKNDEARLLKIKFVTPGYTQECGSVRKHVTTDEQELKLYQLYTKFSRDVFNVLFNREVEDAASLEKSFFECFDRWLDASENKDDLTSIMDFERLLKIRKKMQKAGE